MTHTLPLPRCADAEPIPGYRLIEPLGRGGFGEVWKCEAPGGLFKAIKFVRGPQDELDTSTAAAEELKAVQHIKAIRHPFLLSMERVENINGELVIVMELADKSLQDLLAERRRGGHAGIERSELLNYLREAADVLDLMNVRHNLQHLDIKPANLFLVSDHVKVADFGLVQSLERSGNTPASPLGSITPRYAAPELFRGKISPASDQYSLAVVYQELLSGVLPFGGKNFRQLMLQHTTAAPDLNPLPDADRAVVAQALAKSPDDRFPTCHAFVRALSQAGAAAIPGGFEPSDTRSDLAVSTTQTVGPEAGQCLPDLQYMGCLGRTPTGEAWSARAANGRSWVVNLFYGLCGRNGQQDEEALLRLQNMVHPILPARRVAAGGRGCIVVGNELMEMNLKARFQECRAKGGSGLPRRELIDKLDPVARGLDDLFQQFGVAHLGLNPRNLLLDRERVLVGEFGLLPLLFHPAGLLASQLQPRYAAPELLEGRLGRAADVFSLAIIYHEMLTGAHPFRGRPDGRPPSLEALPMADQAVVARALHPDPAKRFARCGDFIDALGGSTRVARATLDNFQLPIMDYAQTDTRIDTGAAEPASRLAQLVADAIASLPGPQPPVWVHGAGGANYLEGRIAASLPPTGALAKFDGFKTQWQAVLVRAEENEAVFQVNQAATGFWQRLRAARPTLLVELRWKGPRPPLPQPPELTVRIRSSAPLDRAATVLFKETAATIIESLRQQLQGGHERRARERVLWAKPARVTFAPGNGEAGETIECQGKDLSLTGMGLYLPCALAGADVRVNLTPEISSNPIVVNGQFVRVQRCGNGAWYEAGVLFQ